MTILADPQPKLNYDMLRYLLEYIYEQEPAVFEVKSDELSVVEIPYDCVKEGADTQAIYQVPFKISVLSQKDLRNNAQNGPFSTSLVYQMDWYLGQGVRPILIMIAAKLHGEQCSFFRMVGKINNHFLVLAGITEEEDKEEKISSVGPPLDPRRIHVVFGLFAQKIALQLLQMPKNHALYMRFPYKMLTGPFEPDPKHTHAIEFQIVPVEWIQEFIKDHPEQALRQYLPVLHDHLNNHKIPAFAVLTEPKQEEEMYLLVPLNRPQPVAFVRHVGQA